MKASGFVVKKSASGTPPYEAEFNESISLPAPKSNEVVVEIIASALNHRDNWITQGMYPGITPGVILGSDCVGIISVSQDALWKQGTRVVLDPSVGWGKNSPLAPQGKLSILGMPANGTFASHIVIPTENLRRCPEFLTDVQAAALPLAGVTAYRAVVTKGKCTPTSLVLVTGIGGGVAIFAAQIAKALGAKVFVTSSSDEKIAVAKSLLHVDGGVNYKTKSWTAELLKQTGNRKFDVIVDGGGELDALCKLASGGARIVSYGSTASPSVNLVLPTLFLNNVEIMGTAMGSPEDFNGLMQLVESRRIVPVVDEVFALREFPLALDKMRQGKQFGKLVLRHLPSKL